MKYKPRKHIAIDVDGTLFKNGAPDQKVVEFAKQKKANGFTVVVWSARGEKHAEDAVNISGLRPYVDGIASKPGYILDDKGWNWTRYTVQESMP